MRTIISATGKTVKLCHAIIYVREAHAKTLQFMPKQRQINRMIGFNKSILADFYKGVSNSLYNSL